MKLKWRYSWRINALPISSINSEGICALIRQECSLMLQGASCIPLAHGRPLSLLCAPRSVCLISWLSVEVSYRCCCAQSCTTLWDPMDSSLPGYFVHGISQATILELVTISFSRASSDSGIKSISSPCPLGLLHCRQILYPWATWETCRPRRLHSASVYWGLTMCWHCAKCFLPLTF